MAQTAYVGFVVGGKILDRRMPEILQPNLKASARSNQRTMTEEEWDQFCLDVEASMHWENHWRNFLSKPVFISSILTLLSFGMMIAWSTHPSRSRDYIEDDASRNHDAYETDNQPRADEVPINSHRYNYTRGSYNYATRHGSDSRVDFFMENFLPDICVMLVLITFVSMTISFVQVSLNLQESVNKVCEDYTKSFLPFHGISFSVERKRVPTSHNGSNNQQHHTLASPASRPAAVILSHSRNGAHTTTTRNKIRSCIVIRKYDDEETASAKSHQANSTNLLIPSYQLSAAPFFDVPKPNANTLLLPPSNRFAGVLVPQTLPEK